MTGSAAHGCVALPLVQSDFRYGSIVRAQANNSKD